MTQANDEISLREIVSILKKRKWLVFVPIVICLIIAIISIVSYKKMYAYTQGILPANYYVDGKIQFLESPGDLISRVNMIYIPEFIDSYNATNPTYPISLLGDKVQFVIPKDVSNEFYLSAEMPRDRLAVFQQLSQAVLNNMQASQLDLINISRQQNEQTVAILQTRLPKYQQLDNLMQNSLKTAVSSTEQNNNTTSLSLSDYLAYGMMQQKQEALVDLQLQIISLQQQLATLKATSFYGALVASPVRDPIGIAGKIILAIVLGFIIGVFLAFMVEGWQQVKE